MVCANLVHVFPDVRATTMALNQRSMWATSLPDGEIRLGSRISFSAIMVKLWSAAGDADKRNLSLVKT